MDTKFQIFLERRTISESTFLGYKNGSKTIVLEHNGNHLFFDEEKLMEYNKEIKTSAGVWRVKPKENDSGEYVDLNDEDAEIKVGKKYQFLGVSFVPQFLDMGSGKGKYYTTIQAIDEEGSDDRYSWVLYADTLEDLEKDIRVNAKVYKREYGLE